MKLKNIKRGYTLAEIMIVLLVLTIIFAVFAPLFTKRAMTTNKGAVWTKADQNTLDAYTFPGDPNLSGQMFFGITPIDKDAVEQDFLPLSKLVIRANSIGGNLQRHIQFRYGRTSVDDGGQFAGSWTVFNNNILLGASFNNIDTNNTTGARNNVAIGYGALNSIANAKNNVAVGYNTLKSLMLESDTLNTDASKNVAVGSEAGTKLINGKNNTFIGYQAGYEATKSNANTFVGYMAGYSGTGGEQNTFIGPRAGKNEGNNNIAIGFSSLSSITSGYGNVAIGTNALTNLESGYNNVALGYGACSEITKSSNKTCIGYNSGPHAYIRTKMENPPPSSAAAVTKALNDGDETLRTYIGSQPTNYGGDAVLEIHNMKSENNGIITYNNGGNPSNTTTVINGNLIVKGRPYFTVGQTLYHFKDNSDGIYSQPTPTICTKDMTSYEFNNGCINLDTSSTSDRRLKNITTRNTSGLSEINKLKVYNFTFKDDKNKLPQIGVMAQDLQKVFPNSVFQHEDGYLRIKWDEMFYAAINAIKELDTKLIALVNRTTKVENQISKLEKENILLKSQVDNLTIRINKLKAQ